ncbi:hypothetical protein ACFL1V_11170 [Pseudomonadota bacterium]
MKSDKLGSWLTLAANLGVIAGLILVAVQINQNTAITKAQIANDYFIADMALELAMMGENPVTSFKKAVYAPDEITTEDAAILDRYFNYGMIQIHRLQKMDDLGLAYEGWEDRVRYLRWHLGNEVGHRWWNQIKGGYSDEFRENVDELLTEDTLSQNRDVLDALMPSETHPQ